MLFLKPTGIDSPDASSRCTWLSVVRAPIATHDVRSAMCCGICVSRNSDAGRQPEVVDVEQQLAREAEPLVDVIALVEIGIVDEPLPADRRSAASRSRSASRRSDRRRVDRRSASAASAYSSAALGVVDRAGTDDRPRAVDPVRRCTSAIARRVFGDDVRGALGDRESPRAGWPAESAAGLA